jgi:hypothetical protein
MVSKFAVRLNASTMRNLIYLFERLSLVQEADSRSEAEGTSHKKQFRIAAGLPWGYSALPHAGRRIQQSSQTHQPTSNLQPRCRIRYRMGRAMHLVQSPHRAQHPQHLSLRGRRAGSPSLLPVSVLGDKHSQVHFYYLSAQAPGLGQGLNILSEQLA